MGQVPTEAEQRIIEKLDAIHMTLQVISQHLAGLSVQGPSGGGGGMTVSEMSRAVELGIAQFRGSRNGGAGW